MVTAFVLIKLKSGREKAVSESLTKVPEIQGIRQVFGDYDLLVRMEAKDFKEVREVVMNKIRSIDGILSTTTLIGVDES